MPNDTKPAMPNRGVTALVMARATTWIAYVALLAGLLLDAYASNLHLPLTVAAVAPLLLFLPGLYTENPRSVAMLCFVCLLYFMVIVTNVFEAKRTAFDIVALIAVVILFVAAMLFSRWLKKAKLEKTGKKGEVVDDR